MRKMKSTGPERPPKRVQGVRVGITRAQRNVLLEFSRQHLVCLKGQPKDFRVQLASEYLLHLACGLKPTAFKKVIRYLCSYGSAEGFNQFFLLDQMAHGALAEWRGDGSGAEGLRPPDGNNGDSKMEAA